MSLHLLYSPPFILDLANACVWRGTKRIALRPKDFAVLHTLVRHAGQLVTHTELLQTAWPDVVVSAAVLKVAIGRVRRVLGDHAAKPRFIESIPRQGYRWIAPLHATPPVQNVKPVLRGVEGCKVQNAPSPSHLTTPSSSLVGRETELAQLHAGLAKAERGERQIVFVTGEPGIGKTALLNAFVTHVAAGQDPRSTVRGQQLTTDNRQLATVLVGRGQCIEQYGPGEPYLPVLEALGRLGQEVAGKQLKPILHQHAPTWLAQMPAILSAKEWQTLQPRVLGATRERMLQELAQALEVLTTDHPLMLVIEDLRIGGATPQLGHRSPRPHTSPGGA